MHILGCVGETMFGRVPTARPNIVVAGGAAPPLHPPAVGNRRTSNPFSSLAIPSRCQKVQGVGGGRGGRDREGKGE